MLTAKKIIFFKNLDSKEKIIYNYYKYDSNNKRIRGFQVKL